MRSGRLAGSVSAAIGPGSATRICRWRGAGLVASRGRGAGALASLAGCPAELILDALTIELTGRFIGRIRQRDEQILKTQPPPLAPRAAALHPAADQILKSQPIV